MVKSVFEIISDYCTDESCPNMTAGPKYEYLWQGESMPKAVQVSAPEYVDSMMAWVDSKISNQDIFPENSEIPFPSDFFMEVFARNAHEVCSSN